MRRLLLALAVLFAAPAALAQGYKPGAAVNDQNPPPVKQRCWDGVSAYVDCPSSPEGQTTRPADNKTVAFTAGAALNNVLFSADTTGYAGVSSQISGTFVGTVTFQGSNDNTTWTQIASYVAGSNFQTASSTSAAGTFFIPTSTRYVRAFVSAYTSGTVTGNALLKTFSPVSPGYVTLNTGVATIGAVYQGYPSSYTATYGNTTVVSATVSGGQVLKASAGLVYALNVTTGATPGYVLLSNSATVPADGAVVPIRCYPVAANTGFEMAYPNPIYVSAGASVSFSTTGCYTKTASATAFIAGDVR